MKRLVCGLLLAGVVTAGSAEEGCAALAQDAKFLPTPDQSECVLKGVDQGLPALTIITGCNLEMNAIAFIESLLVGKRQQVAHARAAAAADGGAPPCTLNFANDNDAGRK